MELKKLLAVFALTTIAVLIVCNCAPSQSQPVSQTTTKITASNGYTYKVITIGNCEYIQFLESLTHKGDCKNPIHYIQ